MTGDMPILALLIYGKGEQVNPTPDQKRAMAAAIGRFREAGGHGRKA